jgi:hypothetical protein
MRIGERLRREVSGTTFALILLLFLMPFVHVSCMGERVASINGYDLLGGRVDLDEELLGRLGDEEVVDARIDHSLGSRVALGAAVAGLVLALAWPRRFVLMSLALAGLAGSLWIRVDVRAEMDAAEATGFAIEFQIGYFLVLVAFGITAALNGAELLPAAGRAPPEGEPDPPG